MKKNNNFLTLLTFIVFILTILISCNNDDSSKNNENEQERKLNLLVGIWELKERGIINDNNIQIADDIDECVKSSLITIKKDNTFTGTYSEYDNKNCVENNYSGELVSIKDSKIVFMYNYNYFPNDTMNFNFINDNELKLKFYDHEEKENRYTIITRKK